MCCGEGRGQKEQSRPEGPTTVGPLTGGQGNWGTPRTIAPVVQAVKNLSSMQKTWVQSLGRKDPLEKEMATHSSILAWRVPWTEETGGLQSMGSPRV